MATLNDLVRVIRDGDFESTKKLLDMKPSLANARSETLTLATSPGGAPNAGRTPLMVAVGLSDLPIVKLLLDRGADPNARDATNCTAEMTRCSQASVWWKTDLEILRALIEKGLDVNIANADGKTLLILAAENNLPEAVRGVLEFSTKRPPNLSHQDLRRWTALMRVAETGAADCVGLMLDKVPPAALRKFVDLVNEFGQGALHLAAQKGHVEVVRMLLQAGCDFTVKDRDGMSAAELAKDAGHREIFTMLDQLIQAALIVEKQAASARPGHAEFSFGTGGGGASGGGGTGHAASLGQGAMSYLGIGRLLPTGKAATPPPTTPAPASEGGTSKAVGAAGGGAHKAVGGSTDALARSASPQPTPKDPSSSSSSPTKPATLTITIPQIGIPLSKILGEHHPQVTKLATLSVDTIDLPVGLVRTLQAIARTYGGQVGLGDAAAKADAKEETANAAAATPPPTSASGLPVRPPLPSSASPKQAPPHTAQQQQAGSGAAPPKSPAPAGDNVWHRIETYVQTLMQLQSQLQAAIMDVQQLEVSAYRTYYEALRPVEESIADLNALKQRLDRLISSAGNQSSLASPNAGANSVTSVADLFPPVEKVHDKLAHFAKGKTTLQTTEGLLSALLTVRNALQTVGDKVGAETSVLGRVIGRTCCSSCRSAYDDTEHQPMALLGKTTKCGHCFCSGCVLGLSRRTCPKCNAEYSTAVFINT